MPEIILPIVQNLADRLNEKRPLIQVIRGPRQVGKTTSLEQLCKLKVFKNKIHFTSGDGIQTSSWIEEQWQFAYDQNLILIIDEIQKIPNWDETIKKLWDESIKKNRHIKCVLTGSSSLNLQKGLTESLTGRFEELSLFHWDFELSNKLHPKMTLDVFLKYGGYPGSYQFINDTTRWTKYITQSIVETVIGKDILFQTSVRSPALFRQSFNLICSYPAQVVSYNKILGQLQDKGNIDLVKHYIDLFESAYLIKTIPKFSKNEIKKKGSSPKIIPFAPALSTFFRTDEISPETLGRIFEAHIGTLFLKNGFNIYYWAEGDYELEYIIEYKNKIIVFDVKSGRKRKSNSINEFLKKYPNAKLIFIDKLNYLNFSKNIEKFINDRV